jgi:hypothetical protein
MSRALAPLQERFWRRVHKTNGCWLWRGQKNGKGYGLIARTTKPRTVLLAHRVSYELCVGLIPPGLQIDHLCRNHSCVNPAHLEVVTQRENLLRGVGFPSKEANQTHCIRGHAFTPANTYLRPDRFGRQCRACRRTARHLHWVMTGT